MRLSTRLRAIADLVPTVEVLADIGTDHGLLPVHLLDVGRARCAVAVDLRPQAVMLARRHARQLGVERRIDVRLGDGLGPLRAGTCDVVVIAGLGGSRIARILERGSDALHGCSRLVIGPHGGARHVRRWLLERGWRLSDERLVVDRGRTYELLVALSVVGPGIETAERAVAQRRPAPYGDIAQRGVTVETQLLMGPLLLEARHPLLGAHWAPHVTRWRAARTRILSAVEGDASPDRIARAAMLAERIARVSAGLCVAADPRAGRGRPA